MADQVRVFVSHHHSPDEDAFTARLVADLETAGADVWVDDERITSDDFIKKINEGMAGRQWLILVMTPDSLRSQWVQAEVNAALHQVRGGRMLGVIPIVAKLCDEGDIPALWATLHRYDATHAYEGARDGLLRALGLSTSAVAKGNTQADEIIYSSFEDGSVVAHNAGTGDRLWHFPPAPPAKPPTSQYPLPDVPARLASLGFQGVNVNGTPAIVPPLITIPAGSFLMGNDIEPHEWHQHRVEVAAFQIAKYPVTVAEYALAVAVKAVREPIRGLYDDVTWAGQQRHQQHPVVKVSWQDAVTYVAWLVSVTGQCGWRLPSEAEWEKAACWDPRTNTSRIYPWGDIFDTDRCNTNESGIYTTSPVGSYPVSDASRSGASAYGVEDMAGNVWEWTSSLFEYYPYIPDDGREDQESARNRTLRGGSWNNEARYARATCRFNFRPDDVKYDFGFRVVLGSNAGR
jgi:formylglycine-generating enzyme required for sulfatase activity